MTRHLDIENLQQQKIKLAEKRYNSTFIIITFKICDPLENFQVLAPTPLFQPTLLDFRLFDLDHSFLS